MRAIWHNPRHDTTLKTLDKTTRAIGVPVTKLLEDVQGGEEENTIDDYSILKDASSHEAASSLDLDLQTIPYYRP